MAYDITDFSRTEISITDGWRVRYVPKFRIYMVLDGDICYLYWTDTEKGKDGYTRLLPLDYNDVTFGYLTPSSASEVKLVIEQYIDSAWTDIPVPATPTLAEVLTAGDGGGLEVPNIAHATAATSAATFGQIMFALHGLHFQFNYANNSIYYFSCLPFTPDTVGAARWAQYIRYNCTIVSAEFLMQTLGTIGTAENISLYIRVNNTTDYLIATVGVAARERVFSNTAMNVTINAGDYIHYKIVTPNPWTTAPTVNIMGGNTYLRLR